MSSMGGVKLVLLGESTVGKSSLVVRFVRNQFFEFKESTIGGMYNCTLLWLLFALCLHKTQHNKRLKNTHNDLKNSKFFLLLNLPIYLKFYSWKTASFLTQTVSLGDTTVKFEIWDTAGTFLMLVKVFQFATVVRSSQ